MKNQSCTEEVTHAADVKKGWRQVAATGADGGRNGEEERRHTQRHLVTSAHCWGRWTPRTHASHGTDEAHAKESSVVDKNIVHSCVYVR